MSRRGGKRHAKRVERSAVPGASWDVNHEGGRTLIEGRPDGSEIIVLGYVERTEQPRFARGERWRFRPVFDEGVYPVFHTFTLGAPSRRVAMRWLEALVNDPSRCARLQNRFDETGELLP